MGQCRAVIHQLTAEIDMGPIFGWVKKK